MQREIDDFLHDGLAFAAAVRGTFGGRAASLSSDIKCVEHVRLEAQRRLRTRP